MLQVGLNPYGVAFTLGLQGFASEPPPPVSGLDQLIEWADKIGAASVEVDWRWFIGAGASALAAHRERLGAHGRQVIVSAWLQHQPSESLHPASELAEALGARLLRLHLTPVLEGARAQHGARWAEMRQHAARILQRDAPMAAALGVRLAIENHQDFGSEDLLELADQAGPNVGLVMDTGNPFSVGEDPVAFATRVKGRVWHVHLKDYRAQFTSEGYRLIRCPLGEGSVPMREMVDLVQGGAPITASLEPAALTTRHIRCFTSDWWTGYRERSAAEFARAVGRLRPLAHADHVDARTPLERHASPEEIRAYEAADLDKAVVWAQQQGWLASGRRNPPNGH